MSKIQKFIEENELDFSGSGSDLNGNCVSLAGYALHRGLSFEDLKILMTPEQRSNLDAITELERVFNFAESHNYGDWWKTPEAKEQYKF